MEDVTKAQVLICKCGVLFCASVEPHCYTSKEFQKELRANIKSGGTVDLIPISEVKEKFGICKCN